MFCFYGCTNAQCSFSFNLDTERFRCTYIVFLFAAEYLAKCICIVFYAEKKAFTIYHILQQWIIFLRLWLVLCTSGLLSTDCFQNEFLNFRTILSVNNHWLPILICINTVFSPSKYIHIIRKSICLWRSTPQKLWKLRFFRKKIGSSGMWPWCPELFWDNIN